MSKSEAIESKAEAIRGIAECIVDNIKDTGMFAFAGGTHYRYSIRNQDFNKVKDLCGGYLLKYYNAAVEDSILLGWVVHNDADAFGLFGLTSTNGVHVHYNGEHVLVQ